MLALLFITVFGAVLTGGIASRIRQKLSGTSLCVVGGKNVIKTKSIPPNLRTPAQLLVRQRYSLNILIRHTILQSTALSLRNLAPYYRQNYLSIMHYNLNAFYPGTLLPNSSFVFSRGSVRPLSDLWIESIALGHYIKAHWLPERTGVNANDYDSVNCFMITSNPTTVRLLPGSGNRKNGVASFYPGSPFVGIPVCLIVFVAGSPFDSKRYSNNVNFLYMQL
jgi:hypothetical protein